jgi:foldase protein PrsA
MGCGSSSGSGTSAVRVGDVPIDRSAIAHWTKAVGLENGLAASLGRPSGTVREKALDLLIAVNWLIGEATARGRQVSDDAVERRLHERVNSAPNGRSEFEQEASSIGRTVADVELELRAEAAAAGLRAMVSGGVAPVTPQDIADYYRQHLTQFHVPEVRVADLIESIPTRTAAIALGERIGPGKRFAGRALREHVAAETPQEASRRDNRELVDAIFAAQPGKVAGPARFHRKWTLIVVRKVIPASTKPLATVTEAIAARLAGERQRLAMSSFLRAFRSKWTAKTDCRAGYVVQKCSQYHGPMTPESNPLTGS